MQDLTTMLKTLRRPRLLIRTARLGAQEYVRDRHLKRILGHETLPRPAAALMRLIEIERSHNDRRKEGDAGYSLPRHLDVLIAMVGEARLLQTAQGPAAG